MPSAIAFLPWVAVNKEMAVGPLRLRPYLRGKLPGDLPHAKQADIDGVLEAYANRPGRDVKKATIFELGNWQTGLDPDNLVQDLFRARNALACAALAKRNLFRGHFGYCNYDTYALVVQRYQAGKPGSFAFTTRRRDGGTTQLWATDMFAFHRPHHVDEHVTVSVDESLLKALLTIEDTSSPLLEAVREFNCANTDSPDVPEHVELVMMKAAFEWLLDIREQANEFIEAIAVRLQDVPPADKVSGPLKDQWEKARPNAVRPLEAWAREFCDRRGASAHGKPRDAPRYVWPARTHLAFASLFFPLLLKKVLADSKLMDLNPVDLEKLARIDEYVMHEPFDFDWNTEEQKPHPWSEIDALAHMRAHQLKFLK